MFYNSPEKRLKGRQDETVVFEEGWMKDSLDRGWFCQVTMDNLCVEAFGTSKWAALRSARRFWQKANAKGYQDLHGYPRVVDCER